MTDNEFFIQALTDNTFTVRNAAEFASVVLLLIKYGYISEATAIFEGRTKRRWEFDANDSVLDFSEVPIKGYRCRVLKEFRFKYGRSRKYYRPNLGTPFTFDKEDIAIPGQIPVKRYSSTW